MVYLRSILRRIVYLRILRRVIRDPLSAPKWWYRYYTFRRRYRGILNVPRLVYPHGRLFIFNPVSRNAEFLKIESLFIKAAQLQGHEPYIMIHRGSWTLGYYRLFGICNFVFWEDYFSNITIENIKEIIELAMEQIQTFQDLLDYQYKRVRIGRAIASSILRNTFQGSLDPLEKGTRLLIRQYLQSSLLTIIVAEKVYTAINPNLVLFLEKGYSPFAEFFEIALQRGYNVIQWCGSHRPNGLTLKRYTFSNIDQHPGSLSEKTWNMLKELPEDERMAAIVKKELSQLYQTGEWWSEVGTQFSARLLDKEDILTRLNLDLSKKTAVIFSHLFWDATFFWGTNLFSDYQEWFIETIRAACKNINLNWIIKLHPANVVKLKRFRYRGELAEIKALCESIGPLPSHIKLLFPDTPISTYSLFSIIDYCLTVRSTAGIESAFFGIPVFTAGTGRYDHLGFTIDSSTKEEYLEKIAKLHTYPRLSLQQHKLAQKFAYGTFILRPFLPKSMAISYQRDVQATLAVDYLIKSREELRQAPDLKILGEWMVNSKDEDYIDRTQLTTHF